MELGLRDRPALVSAASRGLGKACATSLAAEGAPVAICSRDRGELDAARDEIAETTGSTVVAIPADVSEASGAVGFVRQGVEALGGCQILVPNAGGPRFGRFEELTDEDFQTAAELNLFSTLRMAREAIPSMREAGYGRIVIISSIAVKQPVSGLMLSNSIRAAVIGWARTLVDEVGPHGITVNAVMPHGVMTDRVRALLEREAGEAGVSVEEHTRREAQRIPVGRYGQPEDVGDLVAFLASERSAYLSGCFIQVDGGAYRGLL
jgi:3-oxoacyl-[acyl-carrier protein] reductase